MAVEIEAPVVSRPEVLLESMRGRSTLFLGDGAPRTATPFDGCWVLMARVADPAAPPLAGTIAILASEVRIGSDHAPHAIRPLYVRRPDAELARDAR